MLKSQSCEFGSLQDSLIRDRVVVGIRDCKIKERLLRDSELTLERAICICISNEAANESVKCRRKQCKCEHDSKTEKNLPYKKQLPVVEQATRNAPTPKQLRKRCGTVHKF